MTKYVFAFSLKFHLYLSGNTRFPWKSQTWEPINIEAFSSLRRAAQYQLPLVHSVWLFMIAYYSRCLYCVLQVARCQRDRAQTAFFVILIANNIIMKICKSAYSDLVPIQLNNSQHSIDRSIVRSRYRSDIESQCGQDLGTFYKVASEVVWCVERSNIEESLKSNPLPINIPASYAPLW